MNNIFDSLQWYLIPWSVAEKRPFSAEEISQVKEAVVVASEYGLSVKFTMIKGGLTYLPLSKDSIADIGQIVDLSKAMYLRLSKSGEKDINRIEIL